MLLHSLTSPELFYLWLNLLKLRRWKLKAVVILKTFFPSLSFSPFSHHQLKTLRSKISSKSEPGKFLTEDQASFFTMGWQSWRDRRSHPICNFQLHLKTGIQSQKPLPNLQQLSFDFPLIEGCWLPEKGTKRWGSSRHWTRGAVSAHTGKVPRGSCSAQGKDSTRVVKNVWKMYIVLDKIRFWK